MRVGVGISSEDVSWQAGVQAASAAVIESGTATLAIVVGTVHYEWPEVMAGVQSILGDTKLVGASCAGFFSSAGIFFQGIAVLALAGSELAAETALIDARHFDVDQLGRHLGQTLLTNDAGDGAVLCFPDSLDGQVCQFVDALYDAAGPEFRYFGGATGDGWRILTSWQGTDQGLVCQGLSAALLRGCQLAGGVAHGWVPQGPPLVVTRAKGRVVFELDGRPAFDVYAERLGGFVSGSFAETAMRHPLGVCYGPEHFIVRDPLRVVNGTALQFISAIPNQSVAYIMKPEPDPDFMIARNLAEKVVAQLAKPGFALISYCISRYMVLGEAHKDEIHSLLYPLKGQIPFLGILAYGEVGAYADVPQFHNKSISLLMGGE